MDLRVVRFRAYELGFVKEPPSCNSREGKPTLECWCYLEPLAKRNKEGGILAHPCPTNNTPTEVEHTTVNVSWNEDG